MQGLFRRQTTRRCALLPVVAGLWLCDGQQAHAAEQPEPVTVTATLPSLVLDESTGRGQGPVYRIAASDYANRMVTLADIMQDLPAVQLRQSGGQGSFSSLSVRGSSSRQVQVYLDGMLLNDPFSGSLDTGLVSLHDIGRVSVYPLSPPVRYAHTGSGGVVALETRLPQKPFALTLQAGAGSFGARQAGAFAAMQRDTTRAWLSGQYQASDNDFSYANRATWFNPNDGNTSRRRNADVRNQSLSARLERDLPADRTLSLLVRGQHSRQGIPAIQNWADNHTSLDRSTCQLQLHYQDLGLWQGHVHTSHRLFVADAHEDYDNRSGTVGTGVQYLSSHTDHQGMEHGIALLHGAHTWTTLLGLDQYDYREHNRLSAQDTVSHQRDIISGSVAHGWLNSTGSWQTAAALRLHTLHDDTDMARDREHYRGHQFSITHQLRYDTEITATLSREVRLPTLLEAFGQQGLMSGNPHLEAEQARHQDLTLRHKNPWLHLETSLFQRELRPAIVAVYDARGVGRHINTHARVRGMEWQIVTNPMATWQLQAGAVLLASENLSGPVRHLQGKQLPGIYHRTFNAAIRWMRTDWQTSLSYRIDDDLYFDTANNLPARTRHSLNTRIAWKVPAHHFRNTQVMLEIRNLTDAMHEDFNRFPAPGRSFHLTLRHQLGQASRRTSTKPGETPL